MPVEVHRGLLLLNLHLIVKLPLLEILLAQKLFQDFCSLAWISICLAECLLDLVICGVWMQSLQKLVFICWVLATGVFISRVKMAWLIGSLREEDIVIIGAELLLKWHLLLAQNICVVALLEGVQRTHVLGVCHWSSLGDLMDPKLVIITTLAHVSWHILKLSLAMAHLRHTVLSLVKRVCMRIWMRLAPAVVG